MDYYDQLETRDPERREQEMLAAIRGQLSHAKTWSSACAALLENVSPESVTDRATLAAVPVTRKSRLISLQAEQPPFGGLAATELSKLTRVFQSPGPIYEPQARRDDYWRMARALFAAGIRPGDLVHNAFSYHFTPAGAMLESGAEAIGCPVFPAGVGQTEQQVQAIRDLRPRGYVGTPSFLGIIFDKADEMGVELDSVRSALVSGEALPKRLRERLAERGIRALQAYATADLGLIAYETEALEGMVCDEGVLVEIVRPGTGDPVPEGEVGEIVVTTLNPDYPLIRFATGDLSAILPGVSPCGRTNTRINGWMGRADQTTKVRGMFVHPEQVAAVVSRHAEIGRARLVVSTDNERDRLVLHCETSAPNSELADAVQQSLRDLCKLRGEVEFVGPNTLANDGKVIDDQRTYD